MEVLRLEALVAEALDLRTCLHLVLVGHWVCSILWVVLVWVGGIYGNAIVVTGRKIATAGDDHIHLRYVVPPGSRVLDLPHHTHSLDHSPEHNVLSVKVRALHRRDEELRAVRVCPAVSHPH